MKNKDVFTRFVSQSSRFTIRKEVKARLLLEINDIGNDSISKKGGQDALLALYLLCKFITETNIRLYRRKVNTEFYEYSTVRPSGKITEVPLPLLLIPAVNDKRSAKSLLFAINVAMIGLPTYQVKILRNLLQSAETNQVIEV